MKKPRKGTIEKEIIKRTILTVICPFCGAYIQDFYNEYVLMLKCPQCGNPIDLRNDDNS